MTRWDGRWCVLGILGALSCSNGQSNLPASGGTAGSGGVSGTGASGGVGGTGGRSGSSGSAGSMNAGGAAGSTNTGGAAGSTNTGGAAGSSGAAGSVDAGGASGAGGSNPPDAGGSGAAGADAGVATDGGRPDSGPFDGEGVVWTRPAPRATCRAGDPGETGIQGLGVNVRCNIDVIGSVPAENFLSLAWRDTCAYVNAQSGTSVIDVADDAHPVVVKTLTTTGMQSNWESMKVGSTGLLAGYQSNGGIVDVYDVAADCKNPILKKSWNLGGSGHAGNFSPDGTIYYASSMYTSTVYAVDLKDPANPVVITGMNDRGTHDLFIGKGGNRGYFAYPSLLNLGVGSLAIIDLTSVQARAPGAKGTLVKEWTWADGSTSQYPIPLTYRGKDYLVVTDELGSGNCNDPNKPVYGYGHLFDISNEQDPKLVAKIYTSAQGSASDCQMSSTQGGTGFGVGTHYCNVDRQDDPRLLACGLWAGGLRVFDIRNPWMPKEVAYLQTGTSGQVAGLVRILTEKRQLWVQTSTTFYVLKLPDSIIDPILASSP